MMSQKFPKGLLNYYFFFRRFLFIFINFVLYRVRDILRYKNDLCRVYTNKG